MQGFVLARQAHCHLSHASLFSNFSDRVLYFLSRLTADHNPPTSASQIAVITDIHWLVL
jgi:hypothetical protein